MFKTRLFVVLAAVSTTAGCSSGYLVKLDSTPQGATVVCSGTDQGYTPATVRYEKSAESKSYIDASKCTAKWSSGVKATYPAHLKVATKGPTTFTLPRPDAPGYQKDADFAVKVQQMKQDKHFAEKDATGKNHPSTMLCSYVGGQQTCL
jgi:hypothetical protein